MPRLRPGNGSVYRREETRYWWITYRVGGRQIRKSARTTNRSKALEMLRRELGMVAEGRVATGDDITFDRLADLVVEDYVINGRRTLSDARIRLENLRKHFGGMAASAIGPEQIRSYQDARRRAGISNGTINRETDQLSKGFRLAAARGLIDRRPAVQRLRESHPRSGFVTADDLEKILEQMPPFARAPFRFAFLTGWRLRAEVLPLTWDRVDLDHDDPTKCSVRLDPGMTKNGEAREVPLWAPLRALLLQQLEGRLPGVRWVFPGASRLTPIRSPRNYWRPATAAAAAAEPDPDMAARLRGLLIHDLRRSAVRNMSAAGVDHLRVMDFAGHKTPSMFARYNIRDRSSLESAARLLNTESEIRLRVKVAKAQ